MLENSRRDFHTRKKCDCVSLKRRKHKMNRKGDNFKGNRIICKGADGDDSGKELPSGGKW